MPKLYDKATGRLLGEVSHGEVEFLVEQLEEESSADQDYYIDESTLEVLAEAGAPQHLVEMLRGALGPERDGEVRWEADA